MKMFNADAYRKHKAYLWAKGDHERRVADELTARRNAEEKWIAYRDAMRALGYCPNCEEPESECECVTWAAVA